MKLSVIVPVYNVEKYLKKCLDSIINQTYKNLEIILVNDGSTDQSGKICDQYALLDKRIQVIHKINGGASDARNYGLDQATGEYVGFVDSDDWLELDMYTQMMQAAQKYETDIVCCGRWDVHGEIKKKGLCPGKNTVITDSEMFELLFEAKECDVSACDKIYKRTIFARVRYPFGEINEDAAVIYQIISQAKRIALLNQAFYNYNHREGSVTTSRINEKHFILVKNTKMLVEYIKKDYPELGSKVEIYYAKKMIEVASIINNATREDRVKYRNLYSSALDEVWVRFGQLSAFDRLKYILLYLRIYRYIRPLIKKTMMHVDILRGE